MLEIPLTRTRWCSHSCFAPSEGYFERALPNCPVKLDFALALLTVKQYKMAALNKESDFTGNQISYFSYRFGNSTQLWSVCYALARSWAKQSENNAAKPSSLLTLYQCSLCSRSVDLKTSVTQTLNHRRNRAPVAWPPTGTIVLCVRKAAGLPRCLRWEVLPQPRLGQRRTAFVLVLAELPKGSRVFLKTLKPWNYLN